MNPQKFSGGARHAIPHLYQHLAWHPNIDRGLVEMARSYGLSGIPLLSM